VSSSPSAAGTDQESLARPATGVGARPRGEDWPARTEAVRAIGLLVVPAAVVVKLLLSGPGWSEVGRWGVTALSVAAVLTLLGVRWLWMSTTPPFSLRRPPWLRRLSYRVHRRTAAARGRPAWMHAALAAARLDPSLPAMSEYFNVGEIRSADVFNRVATMELVLRDAVPRIAGTDDAPLQPSQPR